MMRHVILSLFLGFSALLLMIACADDATGGSGVTDGDTTGNGECESDSDCFDPRSNFTCNRVAGRCVDHGKCTSNDDCDYYYGSSLPICNSKGICEADGNNPPNPDGDDIPNPTDGDDPIQTDGDSTVDGDTIADGDEDEVIVDGDAIEYDEPELEIDTEPVMCENDTSIMVPTIKVTPNSADFGSVAIGDSGEVQLIVCNTSGVDLAITSLQFARGTSHEFHKFHAELPITLEPGFATPVHLLYMPVDSQQDTGSLDILSNDPNSPQTNVPLISKIKAAPYIVTFPRVVQFSGVTQGSTITKLLEIQNIGTAGTSVTSLSIQGGETSPYSILEIVDTATSQPLSAPYRMDPESSMTLTIAMTMGETPVDDVLLIPWYAPNGEKTSRVDLKVGDSPMCALPNAGPDQTVDPLDTVYLDGSASYDPNGPILGYKWEWVKKPSDAWRSKIMDNAGQNVIEGQWSNEPFPQFYAELAGEYEVKLTVKEDESSCNGFNSDTVKIMAAPEATIHVQLMWTNAWDDHDLHFILPNGSYENSFQDCYYQNCNTINGMAFDCPLRGCPGPYLAPDWGQMNVRIDDPFLDIDDIEGKGPENINYSLPLPGDYKVVVHNFPYTTDTPNTATQSVTVRVFIFGQLAKEYVKGPPSFEQNKKWNVCYVRVHDATNIEVVDIDTVQ